jgi:hypothetical protein
MPYDSKLDRYAVPTQGGPGGRADVLTPTDTGELTVYYPALYVGVSGNLTVTPMRNTADVGVLFTNVPAGWFLVGVRKVWATGTSATGIVGVRD